MEADKSKDWAQSPYHKIKFSYKNHDISQVEKKKRKLFPRVDGGVQEALQLIG